MGQTDRQFSLLWPILGIALLVTAVLPFVGAPSARATGCVAYRAATATFLRGNRSQIALAGTLTAGRSVTMTIVAEDISGNCVAGAPVTVSFTGAGSAHTGAVASCPSVGAAALTSAWATCTTDTNGSLSITYTTPRPLPAAGADFLHARLPLAGSPADAPGFEAGYVFGPGASVSA